MLDPCPGRTQANIPCARERYHVGGHGVSDEERERRRQFVHDMTERAKTMRRVELEAAVEYHLLAWRVLRNEYNAR